MNKKGIKYLGYCFSVCILAIIVFSEQKPSVSFETHLRESAVDKSVIDYFLDPEKPSWTQFDPELGYILGNYLPKAGIDGSLTISTVLNNGARTSHLYANRKCRINTYGNSFTQCHQVSDGVSLVDIVPVAIFHFLYNL